jgi:hypothetical protein
MDSAQALDAERQADTDRQADLREQAAKEERDREELARLRVEEAWQAADLLGCSSASLPEACDALATFVQQNPTSSHIDEARDVLVASSPKVLLLKDDLAWRAADPEECRRPKDKTSCVGIDIYLGQFPDGVHSKEARRLQRSGTPIVAKFRRLRQERELRLWTEARTADVPRPPFPIGARSPSPDGGYGQISEVTGLPRTHYVHD